MTDIVDPHHHLWHDRGWGAYLLDDLHADTSTVPDVTQTVFVECQASYRDDGPEHLRPVGETEFVAGIADASDDADGAAIVGIVAHADLSLPIDQLDEVLDAHVDAAGGRFRGIRDALSSAPPDIAPALLIPGGASADKGSDPGFRRGVAHLGERGFTYDTWHYHFQCDAFRPGPRRARHDDGARPLRDADRRRPIRGSARRDLRDVGR